ncbi:DUF5309 family protein [Synechococcus sp. N5]|uniref:SU10 major capsid protein n=1 Tax=Synechococcus sp. N5 TaxID=2575515 RepID=UPI000E0FDC90|nr:DUF5309 family protein [Synechococcus sp. N5]
MIDTENFQGAISPDVLETVVRVQAANENPIYAMLLGGNRILKAKAEKVEWYTTQPASRRTAINNVADNYTDVTTTLAVDDGAMFMIGDTVIAEATGEIMLVTAKPATNSITVSRGIGSVAAADASVEDNAYLMNIGNAHGEGAGSPDTSAAQKVQAYNFLQTFRQAVEISGRMERVETLTEDEKAFQRAEAFKEVTRDIEHALVFGARNNSLADADGKKVTTMGGLREMVTTHVTNQGGAMTHDEFIGWCESVFDTGSATKTLFAGPSLLTVIHKFYDAKVRHNTTITNVGLRIQAIDTPHGTLNLVPHKGLRGAYAGDGIAVDTENLKLRPTEKNGGGRLQLKENTQEKGQDSTREEIFAEHTLDFGAEQNHAQLRGVTAAA